MMNVEMIRAQLDTKQLWEERTDGWWLVDPNLNVEKMAQLMVEAEARLVTITGRPAPEGECRLAYHWDMEGELLTVVTMTHEGSIHSIAAICPAADWVEREIYDYFAVDFIGREDTPPLVLRPDDPPGLFNQNGNEGGQDEL
jgi:Ni,Fe-hydrogenase III component G